MENVLAFVGGDGAQNQARMYVVLKPLNERKDQRRPGDRSPASQAGARSRRQHLLQSVQDLQIGGRASNAQYQYTLSGENLDELYEWAPKLLAAAARASRS